jgi:hypothetical protein
MMRSAGIAGRPTSTWIEMTYGVSSSATALSSPTPMPSASKRFVDRAAGAGDGGVGGAGEAHAGVATIIAHATQVSLMSRSYERDAIVR